MEMAPRRGITIAAKAMEVKQKVCGWGISGGESSGITDLLVRVRQVAAHMF
jgi:hypothetical protein